MTAAIDSLRTAVHPDFMRARRELVEARLQQEHRDSPSNRAAVARCLAKVDTVLDRYLAATGLRS